MLSFVQNLREDYIWNLEISRAKGSWSFGKVFSSHLKKEKTVVINPRVLRF